MKLKNGVWACVFLFIPSLSYSMTLSFVQGSTLGNASQTKGPTFQISRGPVQYNGGGVLLGFKLSPFLQVEQGWLYMPSGYNLEIYGIHTQVRYSALQIPLLFRFFFAPALSFGIGGYTGLAMGSSTGTSLLDKLDYGYAFSLGMYIPCAPGIALILDTRYLYGVNSLGSTNQTAAFSRRDIQLLAGLRLGF